MKVEMPNLPIIDPGPPCGKTSVFVEEKYSGRRNAFVAMTVTREAKVYEESKIVIYPRQARELAAALLFIAEEAERAMRSV